MVDGEEDHQNPYHCMGRYELRLVRQGIKTVLGSIIDEIKAVAVEIGLPPEHLADAITMWEITKGEHGTSTPD